MKRAALLLILCWLPATAWAQAVSTTSVRVITQTRLMSIFSDLENQWLEAVQKKDEPTLNRLLADEFEVWMPAPAGDPIPREDWQKAAFARGLSSFEVRDLAVKGVTDDVSVAKFYLRTTVKRGSQRHSQAYFVVDLWLKTGGDWKCTDRYMSSVEVRDAPSQGQEKRRPSGKD